MNSIDSHRHATSSSSPPRAHRRGDSRAQLAPLTAVQLGSAAIRGALERGGIPAEAVDAVIVGQVLQAGAGQNPARQAAVGAGIGWNVHVRQPSTRSASRGSPRSSTARG